MAQNRFTFIFVCSSRCLLPCTEGKFYATGVFYLQRNPHHVIDNAITGFVKTKTKIYMYMDFGLQVFTLAWTVLLTNICVILVATARSFGKCQAMN